MNVRVLVVYASRHGATREIAERIAARLGQGGVEATLESTEQAGDVAGYDAFVIGSAAYAFHWLKEATAFVRRNRSLLASRPVWLFSSGPLGTETTDAQGRDVRVASEPREFVEFREAIHPRDQRVFFGAYDPDGKPIGFMERFTRMMPVARAAMPVGDFRDWGEIEAWAGKITDDLTLVPAGSR
jgi:menaquinone-dependent protoporphyrinogen oxidase